MSAIAMSSLSALLQGTQYYPNQTETSAKNPAQPPPNTTNTNTSSNFSIPEGCIVIKGLDYVPWDNEDNIVSKNVDDVVKVVFTGILLPLLFVVAFVTNILNLVVFYKHGLKERINACLFTLSLVDLLSLSATYGFSSDVLYMFVLGKGNELGPSFRFYIQNYLVGLYGFVTSSQLLYAVVAAERCLCVTHPLLVKTLMPTRATVVSLWVMTVTLTGCYFFISGVLYSIVCVFSPVDGTIAFANYPRDIYFRHRLLLDVLYSLIYGLIFPGFSFVCVTVCTVVTAVKVTRLSRWRQKASTTSGAVTSRDVALTRMIIGTSVLFIVCIVPAVAMRTSFLVVPELRVGGRHDNMAWVIRRFYIFFSAVNNSFNFFIYYAFGTRFRETARALFFSRGAVAAVRGVRETSSAVVASTTKGFRGG